MYSFTFLQAAQTSLIVIDIIRLVIWSGVNFILYLSVQYSHLLIKLSSRAFCQRLHALAALPETWQAYTASDKKAIISEVYFSVHI
jgi:hypothetical protein